MICFSHTIMYHLNIFSFKYLKKLIDIYVIVYDFTRLKKQFVCPNERCDIPFK